MRAAALQKAVRAEQTLAFTHYYAADSAHPSVSRLWPAFMLIAFQLLPYIRLQPSTRWRCAVPSTSTAPTRNQQRLLLCLVRFSSHLVDLGRGRLFMLRMLLSRRTHLLPMNSTQHSSVPLASNVHRHSPSFLPGTQTMLLAPRLFVNASGPPAKSHLLPDFP